MAPPPLDRLTRLMAARRTLRFDCPNENCRRVLHFAPKDIYDWFRGERMIARLKVRCDRCGHLIEGATDDAMPGTYPRPPKPEPIGLETRPPRPPRQKDEPRRLHTLAEWRRGTPWLWWYCERFLPDGRPCGQTGALALVPYILYFGPDASETVLTRGLQCPRCLGAGEGASIRPPSMNGSHGPQAFPPDRVIMPAIVAEIPRDDGRALAVST